MGYGTLPPPLSVLGWHDLVASLVLFWGPLKRWDMRKHVVDDLGGWSWGHVASSVQNMKLRLLGPDWPFSKSIMAIFGAQLWWIMHPMRIMCSFQ